MKKANKTMVKFTFDTYDSLRKQVHGRIIDYINAGEADDIDMNDPLRSTELADDIMTSDRKLYFNLGDYRKMASILGNIYGFRDMFSAGRPEITVIMSAWQLIFLAVFMEYYHEFKYVWNKRMISNG